MKSVERRLFLLFLIVALSLLFPSVAVSAESGAGIDDLVGRGIESYNAGNYKTAYDLFSQAMKINPNHVEASKWFWKMKSEFDVKTLQDRGTAVAGSSGTATGASGAGTAEGAAGVRYVYSEAEQQALLEHLKSLDERLSLLSGQIGAGSSVDKSELDERLLAISRDLSALSTELHAIDVRDDLGEQLAVIARDVETLKDRDVGLQLDQKLSALSEEIRRLDGSGDQAAGLAKISREMSTVLDEVRRIDVDRDVNRGLAVLSRDLEGRLAGLQERIQGLDEAGDSRNVEAQLSLIGSELGRLAEEAAKTREASPVRTANTTLLIVLAACAVVAAVLLIVLVARQTRYQRRAAFSAPPVRPLDDMLATADTSPLSPSSGPPRDGLNLSEIPPGQREDVVRQLTELISRDKDLRSRLARSLGQARSTEGGSSSRVTRTGRR
jgi:tetratricopeptide (TPR) repeat protein